MKKRVQERGEYDWSAEDLIELQSQPFELIEKIYNQFGDIVISGCAVTGNRIESGVVCLGGVAMPFDGAEGVTFPCYLVTEKRAVTGRYVDGLEKPISYDYKAVISAARPEDESFVTVQSMGVEKLLKRSSDAVDSDSSNTVATSKAVSTLNKKITELASKELPKSDAIDLENSDMLATSMAVATLGKRQATENTLGSIKAKVKTTETEEIAIDTVTGKLFAPSRDEIPVNTILTTTTEAGNVFGDKFLKCDGSKVSYSDYKGLASPMDVGVMTKEAILPVAYHILKFVDTQNVIYESYAGSANAIDKIYKSTDSGVYEQVIPNIIFNRIRKLRYINNMYTLLEYRLDTERGLLYTSTDLINWEKKSYPTDIWGNNGIDIVYYNNAYKMLAIDDYARLYSSPDLNNWTVINHSSNATSNFKIVNNLLFIVDDTNVIRWSSDGFNFSDLRVDYAYVKDILYINNSYLIFGCTRANSINIPRISKTDDLINCTILDITDKPSSIGKESLCINKAYYLDVLDLCIAFTSKYVLISFDKINWRYLPSEIDYNDITNINDCILLITNTGLLSMNDIGCVLPQIDNSYIKALY